VRAISHIRRYGIVIFSEINRNVNGVIEEVRPLHVAEFMPGDITSEELTWAERFFKPHGRTYEADEVTPSALLGRMSSYDTEAPANLERYAQIDDIAAGEPIPGHRGETWEQGTTKRLTEERLRQRVNGLAGDFAIVEQAPLSPPWPTYDEFKGYPRDIIEKLIEDGHHLPEALAYERQNQNRADLVEDLEATIEARRESGELVSEEDVILA
jgi:hypothetical protein